MKAPRPRIFHCALIGVAYAFSVAAVESKAGCPKNTSSSIDCSSFPKVGCLYFPGYLKSKQPSLLYIRGLIQSKAKIPQSTKNLFDSSEGYNLKRVAESNGQIIFATHKSEVSIPSEVIQCLKKLSSTSDLDVASHSNGVLGIIKNQSVLKNGVRNLYLLDNFYVPEGMATAVDKIKAKNCSGFYTSHNSARLRKFQKSLALDCDISKATKGHVGSVAPFLLERSGSSAGGSKKSH